MLKVGTKIEEAMEVDMEFGEDEFVRHRGARTSSDDANVGWIYYTYNSQSCPFARYHPDRNDDGRFRRPPHPNYM